jgi:benzodiazapine receptor
MAAGTILQALNRDDRQALVLNVALAVGAAVIVNAAIFLLGWNSTTDYAPQPWFEPPDWVIGVVWLVLFSLMASARWTLNSYTIIGVVRARAMITVLIICCLLWPFYSLATGSLVGGLVGNIITIALAVAAMVLAWPRSRDAALFILPVVLWLSFAILIVLAEMGRL